MVYSLPIKRAIPPSSRLAAGELSRDVHEALMDQLRRMSLVVLQEEGQAPALYDATDCFTGAVDGRRPAL
jgi:hypothetical protein